MVKNSKLTYGQLIHQAHGLTDKQEIGETVQPIMKQLEDFVNETVQKQAEACMAKGFTLDKYYIHIAIMKDPHTPNCLKIVPYPIRRTRPSPYQQQDHYLWSVTNMNQIQFEWCIPSKEILTYILKHPNEFDQEYIRMLHKYCKDKIDKIEDYMIDGKLA